MELKLQHEKPKINIIPLFNMHITAAQNINKSLESVS